MNRIGVGIALILAYVVLLVIPLSTATSRRGDLGEYALGLGVTLLVPAALLIVFGWRSRYPHWFALRQLRSADVEIRRAAASGLRGRAKHPSRRAALGRVVEPLLAALSDDDARVRSDVAWVLAIVGDRRSTSALLRALFDADADVRENSTTALYHMYQTREAMADALQRSKEPDVDRILDAMTVSLTVGDCCCHWCTVIEGEDAVARTIGRALEKGESAHFTHVFSDNSRAEYRCKRTDAVWVLPYELANDQSGTPRIRYTRMRRIRYRGFPWPPVS